MDLLKTYKFFYVDTSDGSVIQITKILADNVIDEYNQLIQSIQDSPNNIKFEKENKHENN